jgi:putative transposase
VERLQQIARAHPRYGYRRACAVVRRDVVVNHKRVYRLWKQAGLGLKRRVRRRRRGTGTLPLQARYPGHVWTYDFLHDACMNGRKLKLLTVVDEFTREALAIEVASALPSRVVKAVLNRLFHHHGAPQYLRSDNGPEFLAKLLRTWLTKQGTHTLYIEPGCPWQNGKGESVNGRLRDECLNTEVFLNLAEAKVRIEHWRHQYNTERPHSSLGYRTPYEFKQAAGF